MFRRFVRESAFNLVRRDFAMFLMEHEDELLQVFRDEIQQLDDSVPEENLFIDIKMVPLGEMVVKAALRAMCRFLTDEIPEDVEDVSVLKDKMLGTEATAEGES